MANKEKALEAMKNNLLTYKDAIVVLGNDLIREAYLFNATENNEDIYSRKQMIKKPLEFWNFYKENIAENEDNKTAFSSQDAVIELLNTGIVKTVIDMNYDGYIKDNMPSNIEYINYKGDRRELYCTGCKQAVQYDSTIENDDKKFVHSDFEKNSKCNGTVQPTVPFYNQRISQLKIQEINDCMFDNSNPDKPELKTHALILIGADFSEDILSEILESYCAVRGQKNLTHLLMMITYKNPDLIDLYKAEFGTIDDIDESIYRLIELLKK